MSSELKPCPFCGGEVEHWTEGAFHYGVRGYSPRKEHITCKTCNTKKTQISDKLTKADAITAWNTRTQPQPDGDVVDIIEALVLAGSESYRRGLADNLKAAIAAMNMEAPDTARVKSPGIRQIEEPSDSSGGTPASRTGLANNCEGSAPTLSEEEAVEIILEAWGMRQKKLSPLTRWLAEDAYRALAKRLGWVDVPFVEGE